MISTRIRAAIRQQWAGLLALLLVLTGGTAYATHPGGEDTIDSADIINNSVKAADVRNDSLSGGGLVDADLRPDSVGTSEVLDESLTGADVDEATLGQVPAAKLGGVGRWTSPSEECDVEVTDFVTCTFTTLNLPVATRVLLIGVVKAQSEEPTASSQGECLLATQNANIGTSLSGFTVGGIDEEHVPLVATAFVGPGSIDFGVRCKELAGGITYFDTAVAAVALSSN